MIYTLVYVGTAFFSLLPWSYIVKGYGIHIKLSDLLKQLKTISKELRELPDSKVKKKRILMEKYKEIRGKVSRFVIVNILLLWIGVVGSLLLARFSVIALAYFLGQRPFIPSPLNISFVSINGGINDLFLYLAVLLAYLQIHNRISGMKLVQEWRE